MTLKKKWAEKVTLILLFYPCYRAFILFKIRLSEFHFAFQSNPNPPLLSCQPSSGTKRLVLGHLEMCLGGWTFQLPRENTLIQSRASRCFGKKQTAWYAHTSTSQIQKLGVMSPALKSFLRRTVARKEEATYGRCGQQRCECCQPKVQNRHPCFFSSPKIFVHVNHHSYVRPQDSWSYI